MGNDACVGSGGLSTVRVPALFRAVVARVVRPIGALALLVSSFGAVAGGATDPSAVPAGGEPVPGVSEQWYPLNNDPANFIEVEGLDGVIHDVIVWDDGSAIRLFIGGLFKFPGSFDSWQLAYLDGDGWVGVPTGMSGTATALNPVIRALEVSTEGDLLIGGTFTTQSGNGLAGLRADGTRATFFAIGEPPGKGSVFDIGYSAAGSLVIVGDISITVDEGTPDEREIRGTAVFDGVDWSPIGLGFNGTVRSLAIVDDVIHVAGTFTLAEDNPITGLARRVGGQWLQVGEGVDGTVNAIEVRPGTSELYIGGEFTHTADGVTDLSHLARWDPFVGNMEAVASGLASSVTAIGFQSPNELYVGVLGVDGADLRTSSGLPGPLAQFDGGVEGRVRAIGQTPSADLVVAGELASVGDPPVTVESVAVHDGAWRSLADPQLEVDVFHQVEQPLEMGGVADDSLGNVYVGLKIDDGGLFTGQIMHWDGQGWQQLPQTGVELAGAPAILVDDQDRLYPHRVFARIDGAYTFMPVWDGVGWAAIPGSGGGALDDLIQDDAGNLLGVGSLSVTGLGNITVGRWTGAAWETWGGGLAGESLDSVAMYQGRSFVGGRVNANFLSGSAELTSAAFWSEADGKWLGAGRALEEPDSLGTINDFGLDQTGRLVVAGRFDHQIPPGVPLNNIGWLQEDEDSLSSRWQPLGDGTNGEIINLAQDAGGRLLAVGRFTEAGGMAVNGIARWNGTTWEGVGGGANASITDIDLLANGDIAVTGSFSRIGGQAIRRVAAYGEVGSTVLEIDPFEAVGIDQPVTVTAVLAGVTAPDAGVVSFAVDGDPIELCEDDSLLSLDASSVEASCDFSFDTMGTRSVTAHYWGGTSANGTWAGSDAAPVMFDVRQAQTLTFDAVADQVFAPGGTFEVSGTASSGLPVAFASISPIVCSASGSIVSILAAGTCALHASQPGNDDFAPAATVEQEVPIARASQVINVTGPERVRFVAAETIDVLATASSGLDVTSSSLTPAVCTVSGDTVSMLALGVCNLSYEQAGDANWLAAPTEEFAIELLADDVFSNGFEANGEDG